MPYTYEEPDEDTGLFDEPWYEVRYLVNDKTPAAPFSLSDAEVKRELAQAGGSVYRAAAEVAFQMALAYGRQAVTSKSVGSLSISRSYSGLQAQYEALSRMLRRRGNGRTASAVFTGDEAQVEFFVGQHDNEDD